MRKLVSFWPTPAFATEILHIYTAEGLKHGKHDLDEDEFLEKEILSFSDVLRMVHNGRIKDSKTIIAILFFNTFA